MQNKTRILHLVNYMIRLFSGFSFVKQLCFFLVHGNVVIFVPLADNAVEFELSSNCLSYFS